MSTQKRLLAHWSHFLSSALNCKGTTAQGGWTDSIVGCFWKTICLEMLLGRIQFSCERKTAEPEQKQSSLLSMEYSIEYSSMVIQLHYEACPRQLYCGEQVPLWGRTSDKWWIIWKYSLWISTSSRLHLVQLVRCLMEPTYSVICFGCSQTFAKIDGVMLVSVLAIGCKSCITEKVLDIIICLFYCLSAGAQYQGFYSLVFKGNPTRQARCQSVNSLVLFPFLYCLLRSSNSIELEKN